MKKEATEVALSHGPVSIRQYTGQEAPNYRALWRMLVDGEISGRQVRGRWIIDVPTVARQLGLTAKKSGNRAA
ncbi:MAG: hypothetical protein ACJ8AW_06490 [Rhodopila sp.]